MIRGLSKIYMNSSSKLQQMTRTKRLLIPSTHTLVTIPKYPIRLYFLQADNMTISYEEIKKATLINNVLIIDVREPDEITEHGKIPNSVNIPLKSVTKVLSNMTHKEFEETYNRKKPSEDSPIIFYCMIGKRSGKAQESAINLGYKQTKNYLGSWTDWASRQSK